MKEILKILSFCQERPLLLRAPTAKKPSYATGHNWPSHDTVREGQGNVWNQKPNRNLSTDRLPAYTRSLPFICLLHNVAEPQAQRHPLDFGSRGALDDTQSSLLDDNKLHRFPTPIPLENVSMAQTTADIRELSDV
jgi:hypothetical protein